jgi:hypothetical protein
VFANSKDKLQRTMYRSDQNQATKKTRPAQARPVKQEQQGTQPTHRWPTRPTEDKKVNNLPDLAQDSGADGKNRGGSVGCCAKLVYQRGGNIKGDEQRTMLQ